MTKHTSRSAAPKSPSSDAHSAHELHQAPGGEWHQRASGACPHLTTSDGSPIADNQNTRRAHPRGPSLLADPVFLDKLSNFDRERIPERVVHARASAAHGYFELTHSLDAYTTAKVLTQVGTRTPVFTRLSTVAGPRGSADTVRDVRGFSVKFYTEEGNWDLVGNNIPVFFIQDSMKFPDLVHAVKQEPDRGFPSAASAHDTFWDFVSHMPESMHMLQWVMSDRTIPRSLRMMEGFGVHTFKLINAKGETTLVKFHWRPVLGAQSLLWDEAVKISGADPDYHRRDLWEAIDKGAFPAWELAVQLFTETQAAQWPFDVLDATKLVPEELVPLQVIGHMVLDRNPDNFFAETEQVAFCPSRLVPGIDFSEDPLLQGRVFSYRDTQMHRLGGPNFQQLPINRPRCPVNHFMRDGFSQQHVPQGQVAYEPNGLAPSGPREAGYGVQADHAVSTAKSPTQTLHVTHQRAESFADHYSQASMFYRSQTEVEQNHIVAAFVFELSKVQRQEIRERMIRHLKQVDATMAKRVAMGLGFTDKAYAALTPMPSATAPQDLPTSSALQLIGKLKPTLHGRCAGILIDHGTDAAALRQLCNALDAHGACYKLIAPHIQPVVLSDGAEQAVDAQLAGAPSVLFDTVAVLLTATSASALAGQAAALGFVRDAYTHLKAIAIDEGGQSLLQAAGLTPDAFICSVDETDAYMKAASARLWTRESKVQPKL